MVPGLGFLDSWTSRANAHHHRTGKGTPTIDHPTPRVKQKSALKLTRQAGSASASCSAPEPKTWAVRSQADGRRAIFEIGLGPSWTWRVTIPWQAALGEWARKLRARSSGTDRGRATSCREALGKMFELRAIWDAERPRDEPPGQPRLVSRQTQPLAGRVGSIELLGGGKSTSRHWAEDLVEGSEGPIGASVYRCVQGNIPFEIIQA